VDENADAVEIGQRIKEAREARGLKPIHLAKALKVSLSTVLRWEKGTSIPERANAIKLGTMFDRDPADFMSVASPSMLAAVQEVIHLIRRLSPQRSVADARDLAGQAEAVTEETREQLRGEAPDAIREAG